MRLAIVARSAPSASSARAAALYAGLADGSLTLPIGKRYRFEQIREAHADLERRATEGKPLLEIADLP